ncbi:MAG: DUF2142 domain-containing protein, partial [Pseudomonadota bacterium]
VTFYLIRISLFLASTAMIYYAIKITPILKWQLFLLALYPTTVFIRSSISADSLMYGYVFLFIALINYQIFSDKKIGYKYLAQLSLLAVMLCLSKSAYCFILGMFFLLKKDKFISSKQYIIALFAIVILPFILNFSWVALTLNAIDNMPRGEEAGFRVPLGIDPKKQFLFCLNNPIEFLSITMTTLFIMLPNYIKSLVSGLGLLDVFLPGNLTLVAFIILFIIPFKSKEENFTITRYQRNICWFLFLISMVTIFFILYLTGSNVGAIFISGLQGRYFMPIIPLMLFALSHQMYSLHYNLITKLLTGLVVFLLSSGLITFMLHDYNL